MAHLKTLFFIFSSFFGLYYFTIHLTRYAGYTGPRTLSEDRSAGKKTTEMKMAWKCKGLCNNYLEGGLGNQRKGG